jgi:hypothetical protein
MTIPVRKLLRWIEYLDETCETLKRAGEGLDACPLRSELFASGLKMDMLRSQLLYCAVEDAEVG